MQMVGEAHKLVAPNYTIIQLEHKEGNFYFLLPMYIAWKLGRKKGWKSHCLHADCSVRRQFVDFHYVKFVRRLFRLFLAFQTQDYCRDSPIERNFSTKNTRNFQGSSTCKGKSREIVPNEMNFFS